MVDVGSHTCKAGYAGEDAPKAVFPSVRTRGRPPTARVPLSWHGMAAWLLVSLCFLGFSWLSCLQ